MDEYDADDNMMCGVCRATWNDHKIPTPAGRCPWEYDHDESDY